MMKLEPKDHVTAADIQFIVLMIVAYALASTLIVAGSCFLMELVR